MSLELKSGPASRREFLHQCAICSGVAALPLSWAKLLEAVEGHHYKLGDSTPALGDPVFKYFTPEQAATIEAVAEQMIPADQDPGAKWAGVVHYMDLGLAGELKEYRATYAAGLKNLATLTKEVSEKAFVELDFATQTKILEKLEADEVRAGGAPSGREFFQLVRRHTLEGFFGDPKYGGNREQIGWKILKFEG